MNPHFRNHRKRWIAAALVAVLLLLILLWDWNWLRPTVERRASAALGREVSIERLELDLWRTPELRLHGLRVGNPAGFTDAEEFAGAQMLALRFELRPLLRGDLVLPRLHLEAPRANLLAPENGAANWVFALSKDDDEPARFRVQLHELSIRDGVARVRHPAGRSDFSVQFATQEVPGAEPSLHASAEGRYAGQPIDARLESGALLNLRGASNPYPVKLEVRNGATRLALNGTLLDPLRLGGAAMRLELEGADMAALYPLTGVPLPATAAYTLQGALDYVMDDAGAHFVFENIEGKVGASDLSGALALHPLGERLKISGALASRSMRLSDLGGFVGEKPGAGTTPKPEGRVLPHTPINLPKLRSADFDVRYTAQRIQATDLPFDDLSAHLRIDDGVLRLLPLSFGIGEGRISTHLLLDGTKEPARVKADADFQRVDFGRVLAKTLRYRGSGRIDGRMNLDARGNSVAALLGAGNGQLRLSMSGGDVSALLINLAGLDFGNALLSAIGIPSRTKLRCMVADVDLKSGELHTNTMLLDTEEANLIGSGKVNLRDETLDYHLRTQPKTLSVAALSAPLDITGTFAAPRVRPNVESLARRGGAALALGVVATPLAALIPTVQLGRGKDVDCDTLVSATRREASKLPRVPEVPDRK